LLAGLSDEPIFDGPFTTAGAPTPPRKRRWFATSVRAFFFVGAPARIAHGCGSPKIAPAPISDPSSLSPRAYQPLPVHRPRTVFSSSLPRRRTVRANSRSPSSSARSASRG
jgi:hypothetical protein